MRPKFVRLALVAVVACGTANFALARQVTPADQVKLARAGDDTAAEKSPLLRRALLDVERTPLAAALEELHLRSGVNLLFSPSRVPERVVSCACKDSTVEEALRQLLRGIPLRYEVVESEIVIVPVQATKVVEPTVVVASAGGAWFGLGRIGDWLEMVRPKVEPVVRKGAVGIITGRVTDAATGQGLSGVSVIVEGTKIGATTTTGGGYRITGVPAGTHTVAAVLLGYARQTQKVTVGDGTTAEAAFVLEREAIALDELVVTGSMVQTKVRALPTPITVITADEIEKLGITRPDQLFRGTIPGAVSFDTGPYAYYSEIAMRGKSSLSVDQIKTYVDGVEVMNSAFIATIDPASIERIEILRGPQAATMYGSDAGGGVLQIFTKKGRETARPTIQVNTSFGFVDGKWVDKAGVPQTNNSLSITGGEKGFTYNLGGSYLWFDEWTPGGDTKNYSAFGTLRVIQGPLQATVSGRWYRKNFGWPLNPILRDQGYEFYQTPRLERNLIHQSGISVNLVYTPVGKWSNSLTVGYDANNMEGYTYEKRLTTPDDTLYYLSMTPGHRMSVRYETSLRLDLAPSVSTTIVGGFDFNEFRQNTFSSSVATAPWGRIPGDGGFAGHYRWTNSGYFIQTNTGLNDRLFLTAGVRVENNENVGEAYGKPVAPRVGLAYTFGREDIEVKTRAAWGKAIRPPYWGASAGSSGPGYVFLPNLDIGPEEMIGWDAGVEMQFRDRGSLAVTYYDQMAKNLIELVLLEGTPTAAVYQAQNVGEIENSGWEIEGKLFLRPLPVTLSGTFTATKSIMGKRAPDYDGDIQIGESMLAIPDYSAGLSATYSYPKGTVSLSALRVGSWVNYDWIAMYGFYFGGDEFRGSMRDYWMKYEPVSKFSFNTAYSISSTMQAYLQVDNLANSHRSELDNTNITTPRTFMFGLRFTY